MTNLLASVGILRASIEPRSMGKRNPVTNNRTAKRPAQNRRVAIIVTP